MTTDELNTKADSLLNEINEFKNDTDIKIDGLTGNFIKPENLVLVKHDLYKERKDLVSKRLYVQNEIAYYNKMLTEMNRNVLVTHKGSNDIPTGFLDSSRVPKNDYERDIIYGNYTKELGYLIALYNNFLNYISDQISTVDKMIYGIPYVIELENFRYDFNHKK